MQAQVDILQICNVWNMLTLTKTGYAMSSNELLAVIEKHGERARH